MRNEDVVEKSCDVVEDALGVEEEFCEEREVLRVELERARTILAIDLICPHN